MNFKNLKISQKLFVSFAIVVAVFVSATLYQIISLRNLGELQHEGARRALDALDANEAAALGYQMYQIIADAQINKDLEANGEEWKELSMEDEEDFKHLENIVDTDAEKEWLAEAKEISEEIFKHREEILTILNTEVIEETDVMIRLREIDGEVDEHITEFEEVLKKMVASLNEENAEADEIYDATQIKLMQDERKVCNTLGLHR